METEQTIPIVEGDRTWTVPIAHLANYVLIKGEPINPFTLNVLPSSIVSTIDDYMYSARVYVHLTFPDAKLCSEERYQIFSIPSCECLVGDLYLSCMNYLGREESASDIDLLVKKDGKSILDKLKSKVDTVFNTKDNIVLSVVTTPLSAHQIKNIIDFIAENQTRFHVKETSEKIKSTLTLLPSTLLPSTPLPITPLPSKKSHEDLYWFPIVNRNNPIIWTVVTDDLRRRKDVNADHSKFAFFMPSDMIDFLQMYNKTQSVTDVDFDYPFSSEVKDMILSGEKLPLHNRHYLTRKQFWTITCTFTGAEDESIKYVWSITDNCNNIDRDYHGPELVNTELCDIIRSYNNNLPEMTVGRIMEYLTKIGSHTSGAVIYCISNRIPLPDPSASLYKNAVKMAWYPVGNLTVSNRIWSIVRDGEIYNTCDNYNGEPMQERLASFLNSIIEGVLPRNVKLSILDASLDRKALNILRSGNSLPLPTCIAPIACEKRKLVYIGDKIGSYWIPILYCLDGVKYIEYIWDIIDLPTKSGFVTVPADYKLGTGMSKDLQDDICVSGDTTVIREYLTSAVRMKLKSGDEIPHFDRVI